MTLAETIKRNNLSYISLESIAEMINHGCNACLTGSDIYQFITEVSGYHIDSEQQGVVTHFGFIFETLSELTADDIDSHYHYGIENSPETLQPVIDAIAQLHSSVCKPDGGCTDDYWNTVIISENGD